MSPIPELTPAASPRRRPSATTLRSPSRNMPISRSNSGTSNTSNVNTTSTSTSKKRPRGEEHLNDLNEDLEQTVIHSPQTHTPPLPQSPEKTARPTELQNSHRGSGGGGSQRGSGGSQRGSGSTSPDWTVMPPPSSTRRSGNGSPERIVPALAPASGGNNVEESEPVTPTEEEVDDESNVSIDDLLVQLPDYNWSGFVSRFSEALKEVGVEKEKLSMEHDMWNWMYEIWSSSRDRDDTRRLSKEMATVIQWTKLKEADLERAREAHTQSMLAISSVLGIAPKNATPPPSVMGKKRVQR